MEAVRQLTTMATTPMRHRVIIAVASCLTLLALVMAVGGCATAARGVVGGALAPCTGNPNGVSSESPDAQHHVDAILYSGDQNDARKHLLAVLAALPRTLVVEDRGTYLHATSTSLVMRFTDDVEFLFAEPGRIQARSCARIGYSDFGVNRSRIETIRERLAKSPDSAP